MSISQPIHKHPMPLARADFQLLAASVNAEPLLGQQVHEPLQPGTVGGPVFRTIPGLRPIVIQVNARQVVIVAVADVAGIRTGERLFETESGGAAVVINPVSTLSANRLVIPVQREIAAIAQALQTIGQQRASNGVSHDESPSSLIEAAILSMPQGSGKSSIAPSLADALGLPHVVDEWFPGQPITSNALHCTHALPDYIPGNVALIWVQ